jgi:predicted ribosome quality control (RQC) complex YloA/Tae2 family protein
MALDGVMLRMISIETKKALVGARVEKVYQPSRDELIISFRGFSGNMRLLLSANADNARAHLTEISVENPPQPPMLCMLLRKHLTGAKLLSILQPELERVLILEFLCHNEMGDESIKSLAVEIMGRYSNIIFFDEDKRILGAVRNVDFTISSKRQVLPGLNYELPPRQDKTSLLNLSYDDMTEIIKGCPDDKKLQKYLLDSFLGLSPLLCREMVYRITGSTDSLWKEFTKTQKERLFFQLDMFFDSVREGKGTPIMLYEPETRRPYDFTVMPVYQYGIRMAESQRESFSKLLDDFYKERAQASRIKHKSQDILKLLVKLMDRVSRKINLQKAELEGTADKDSLRIKGDLLTAYLYMQKKGMKECTVPNYFEEGSPNITIPLDVRLSPAENAQKYYKEYKRALSKEEHLNKQQIESERELLYLDSVFYALTEAQNESELNDIKDELREQGYLPKIQNNSKKRKPVHHQSNPMCFISSDGFEIYAGKNNRQNDRLTLKLASKQDLWLHTKNIHGSHVIIISNGEKIPERTIEEAAIIAATHSRGKEGTNIPVDYTLVKSVKKPAGSKPGMVIYEGFKTAYVNPDKELCDRLSEI